jgi:hypothetical protein
MIWFHSVEGFESCRDDQSIFGLSSGIKNTGSERGCGLAGEGLKK